MSNCQCYLIARSQDLICLYLYNIQCTHEIRSPRDLLIVLCSLFQQWLNPRTASDRWRLKSQYSSKVMSRILSCVQDFDVLHHDAVVEKTFWVPPVLLHPFTSPNASHFYLFVSWAKFGSLSRLSPRTRHVILPPLCRKLS